MDVLRISAHNHPSASWDQAWCHLAYIRPLSLKCIDKHNCWPLRVVSTELGWRTRHSATTTAYCALNVKTASRKSDFCNVWQERRRESRSCSTCCSWLHHSGKTPQLWALMDVDLNTGQKHADSASCLAGPLHITKHIIQFIPAAQQLHHFIEKVSALK